MEHIQAGLTSAIVARWVGKRARKKATGEVGEVRQLRCRDWDGYDALFRGDDGGEEWIHLFVLKRVEKDS